MTVFNPPPRRPVSHWKKFNRGAGNYFIVLLVALFIAVIIGLSTLAGALVSSSKATNALENLGYTNVHIIDKSIWFIELRGCSKDDQALFVVEGTGPDGKVRQLRFAPVSSRVEQSVPEAQRRTRKSRMVEGLDNSTLPICAASRAAFSIPRQNRVFRAIITVITL